MTEWEKALETARKLDADFDSTPGGVPPEAVARLILEAKAEALREAATHAFDLDGPYVVNQDQLTEWADAYERAAKEQK